MPDWDAITKLWKQIFGTQTTSWLLGILGTFFTIWLTLFFISQIIEFLKKTILPLFYNDDEKRRNFKRKLFAEQLEYEINKINRDEREWEDYRFAELEAEIEAEGLHTKSSFIPFIKSEYKGLLREKSLSSALKTSKEAIILLEGEPGSGKSVALRHIALNLLQKAKQSRSNKTILPIYINLRGLKRLHDQLIDRELISKYILFSINRANTRDATSFLDDEFERGLQEGTWLFLFDSFDEIPEVLSARDADSIVRKYADAISDFLHSMNRCRGIVASRYFRGPGHVEWTHFNIVGLTLERQVQLVKQAKILSQKEQVLIGQLATARPEIQAMTVNPLFLSMVIEQALSNQEFPENTFTVFETYVTQRFEQDQERLRTRFGLEHEKVRKIAETIAFCMTADTNIGLSPYREEIKESLKRLQHETISDLDTYFDALEFIKIGRSETALGVENSKSFAFSHRRIQEYFATSFVMRAPDQISPSRLLTDARWRETAVVLCQTQPEEELQAIIIEAGENLYQYAVEVENWFKLIEKDNGLFPAPMLWPPGLLHLLSLLQDGFNNRKHILPEYIRNNASVILKIAQSCGIFPDRKWSLEVAGIAEQSALLDALRTAIHDYSILLNQVAYEQVSRLENIPEDVSIWIRKSLIEKAAAFQLREQRFTTQAFLSRLSNKHEYLRLLRLLLTLPSIDLILHIIFAFILFFSARTKLNPPANFLIFSSVIFTATFVFAMPLISYLLAFTIIDDENPPMGIQPYAISYFLRILISISAIGSIENSIFRSFAIGMSYCLLIPISEMVLIKDGFISKKDLQIFLSPIQVLALGFKERSKKYASSRLLISLFAIGAFITISIGLGNTKAFDFIFKNPTWVFALECLALPGFLIAAQNIFKRRKVEKAMLKEDQQKLQMWEEQKKKHSGDEFLELFKELKTPEYMLKLIANFSDNDKLERNESSKLAIKSAIQYLESEGVTKKQIPVIDEMCILLEHMQASKEN